MAIPYAQALINESQKEGADPKVLVKNLLAHLESQGRMKLLPSILRDLQELGAREEKNQPFVEVAHESESAQALKDAAAHGIHAMHAKVNHSLIKGWRAGGNGKLVDHSAKTALVEIYQKVTS